MVKTLPTHRLPEVCDEVEVEQLVTQVPYLSAGFPAVDLFGRAVIVDVGLGAGLVSCGLSEGTGGTTGTGISTGVAGGTSEEKLSLRGSTPDVAAEGVAPLLFASGP